MLGAVGQVEVDERLIGDTCALGLLFEVVDGLAIDVDGDTHTHTHTHTFLKIFIFMF